MRKNALWALLLLCSWAALPAQSGQPLTTLTLQGNGTAIFMHSTTGLPIVQTREIYAGIDPVTMTERWRTTRPSGATAAQAIDNSSNQLDYQELYGTSLAYLGQSIVDVRTGKVVIDGTADGIQRFLSYNILPDHDLVLIEMGVKGNVVLAAVDPFQLEKRWMVTLREQSGLSQAMNANSTAYVIPPRITAGGDLAYHNGKYLALIAPKTGELKWSEKLDPAYLFTNPAGNRIVVAEAQGGLGGMMSASATPGEAPIKFGKTIHLLDAATGQKVWKRGNEMGGNVKFIMLLENDFLVVHDEGMNIYSFSSGDTDGRWKRDYSAGGIKNVIPQADGFMVYFRNKRMLIDAQTGEEKWKRAENLDREPPAYVMTQQAARKRIGEYDVDMQGNTLLVRHSNGQITSYGFDFYYLDEAQRRAVIGRVTDPNATYLGPIPYTITAINLGGQLQEVSGQIEMRQGLSAVDPTPNGYFFYSDQGFVLMDFNGTAWSQRATQHYRDPTATARGIGNALLTVGYLATQLPAATRLTQAAVTNDEASLRRYESRMNATNQAADLLSGGLAAQDNSRIQAGFAYFFAKNEEGTPALHKVNKETGEEVKQFYFDDKTPIYHVDDNYGKVYYLNGPQLKIFEL